MLKRRSLPTFAVVALTLVSLRPWVGVRAQASRPKDVFDSNVRTILIRYGMKDDVEKTWRGRLEPESADAQVISVSGYQFFPSDHINGHQWEFKTQRWVTPNPSTDLSPGVPGPHPIFPSGMYARVSGGDGGRFRLETGAGSFLIALADLTGRRKLTFADGNIEVETVPTPVLVTEEAGEADFPAIAINSAGRVAVAYQEFLGDRDRIEVREFAPGQAVSEGKRSPETEDVFRHQHGIPLHVISTGSRTVSSQLLIEFLLFLGLPGCLCTARV
jgi:hypothetical protein